MLQSGIEKVGQKKLDCREEIQKKKVKERKVTRGKKLESSTRWHNLNRKFIL